MKNQEFGVWDSEAHRWVECATYDTILKAEIMAEHMNKANATIRFMPSPIPSEPLNKAAKWPNATSR